MTYGQHDKGMLDGKDPFVEHSIATCPGSSGAPIFAFVVNHDTSEIEVDDVVYFLHFYGQPTGKLHGKAVSSATIIRNIGLQSIHDELKGALSDV
jgi:V8-like Glu-specific endopeptidase